MKQFSLSNKAVDNSITIYVFIIVVTLFGIIQYLSTAQEKFPEIVFPYFMISTINPGTSPVDIENLITYPIEKELKGIDGIKHVNSQSLQDISMIIIEFDVNTDPIQAYLDMKKAVDDVRAELPNDLYQDPELIQIDVSEIPIIYVNLFGDVGLVKAKKYADDLKDRIESLEEISKVEIIGALEREIQIDVDLYKMQAAEISFNRIEGAVAGENLTMSGGLINTAGMKRNFRIVGEFQSTDEIGDIMLKKGIYLSDVAQVVDGFADRESYSRMDRKDVISLSVIKRGGQNLITAVDKIKTEIADFQKTASPALGIKITGDTSTQTRNSVSDLFNTIILGFIIVVFILMFFMGELDAIFVGVSIPLSIIIIFVLFPMIGFNLNMVTLMSFIIVLGIVVDNSIVIVENIHRHFTTTENLSIIDATKRAVGEVAMPVFTGTLTTVAPFVPLMFMPGIMGKFISYLPITIILTLGASLLVAYFFNPVFAVSFMKHEANAEEKTHGRLSKKFWKLSIPLLIIAIVSYIFGLFLLANLIVMGIGLYVLLKTIMVWQIDKFQKNILPVLIRKYKATLKFLIHGKRPYLVVGGTGLLFVLTIFLMGVATPKVSFMPSGDPNAIWTYITMPEGTDVDVTNKVAEKIETRILSVLGDNNPDVESIITSVAVNAGSGAFDRTAMERKAKVTVSFVEYKYRKGDKSTLEYLEDVREVVKGVPGAEIEVARDVMGPPAGKALNIEVSGPKIEKLVELSDDLKLFITDLQIRGIEDLQLDMETQKPEIILHIDRAKAGRLGISTGYIASILRTAIYGKEISSFREGEDEYPIQLRLEPRFRDDVDVLLSQNLTISKGGNNPPAQIPISAVADVEYITTYGGIKRIDNARVVTLASNVLTGYNANEIIGEIRKSLPEFGLPEGYSIRFSGEQEMQNEIADYMLKALFIAVALILIILVAQFNSVGKPVIISLQILFSIIGVLLGLVIFNLEISVMMTGMGIIAVAGIVVKNAIILIDYIDNAMEQTDDKIEAIVNGGATRLTPVMLTALSTILGLMPLALGINFNFITLFTEMNPQMYLGGDSAAFWNPLAWTIIFGLSFATFLTLIVVPSMYKIFYVKE